MGVVEEHALDHGNDFLEEYGPSIIEEVEAMDGDYEPEIRYVDGLGTLVTQKRMGPRQRRDIEEFMEELDEDHDFTLLKNVNYPEHKYLVLKDY